MKEQKERRGSKDLSRRDFLKFTGVGFLLGLLGPLISSCAPSTSPWKDLIVKRSPEEGIGLMQVALGVTTDELTGEERSRVIRSILQKAPVRELVNEVKQHEYNIDMSQVQVFQVRGLLGLPYVPSDRAVLMLVPIGKGQSKGLVALLYYEKGGLIGGAQLSDDEFIAIDRKNGLLHIDRQVTDREKARILGIVQRHKKFQELRDNFSRKQDAIIKLDHLFRFREYNAMHLVFRVRKRAEEDIVIGAIEVLIDVDKSTPIYINGFTLKR